MAKHRAQDDSRLEREAHEREVTRQVEEQRRLVQAKVDRAERQAGIQNGRHSK